MIPLGAGAVAAQVVFVYATPAISPGVTNSANQERLVAVVTLTEGMVTAGEFDIRADWAERFGSLTGQTGRKISAHCYQYLQGQLGAAYQVSGIVAA